MYGLIRGPISIVVGVGAVIGAIVVLMMNDLHKDEAITEICPKCGRRTLRRLKGDDARRMKCKWKCANCGNNKDEFGNVL